MQKRIRNTVLSFLTSQKPGKILDIPAGSGWLKESLGNHWNYHCADLYTEVDLPNFKQVNLNHDLPYEEQSFDYVACLEGLEHTENSHHLLREFHRVLKPGGLAIISTPNPLNIKSRRRYFREGTFYGFPHLVKTPKEGEHVHISPINLSFLIAFAKKYGFSLNKVHPVSIPLRMVRFLPRCLWVQAYSYLRNMNKDKKTQQWMQRLVSNNILLNDGIVVSFRSCP